MGARGVGSHCRSLASREGGGWRDVGSGGSDRGSECEPAGLGNSLNGVLKGEIRDGIPASDCGVGFVGGEGGCAAA